MEKERREGLEGVERERRDRDRAGERGRGTQTPHLLCSSKTSALLIRLPGFCRDGPQFVLGDKNTIA